MDDFTISRGIDQQEALFKPGELLKGPASQGYATALVVDASQDRSVGTLVLLPSGLSFRTRREHLTDWRVAEGCQEGWQVRCFSRSSIRLKWTVLLPDARSVLALFRESEHDDWRQHCMVQVVPARGATPAETADIGALLEQSSFAL